MFLFLITTKYVINILAIISIFLYFYIYIYIYIYIYRERERESIFYKTIFIALFFPQAPKPDRKKRRKKDTDIVSGITVRGFVN